MRLQENLHQKPTISEIKSWMFKSLTYAIPILVILANIFLPLRDVIRQAFVGIILIWLYVAAMTGFHFFW